MVSGTGIKKDGPITGHSSRGDMYQIRAVWIYGSPDADAALGAGSRVMIVSPKMGSNSNSRFARSVHKGGDTKWAKDVVSDDKV